MKLLCRLYVQQAGAFTIDGIICASLKRKQLRHENRNHFFGYVHYHLTARENIWLGNTTFRLIMNTSLMLRPFGG